MLVVGNVSDVDVPPFLVTAADGVTSQAQDGNFVMQMRGRCPGISRLLVTGKCVPYSPST